MAIFIELFYEDAKILKTYGKRIWNGDSVVFVAAFLLFPNEYIMPFDKSHMDMKAFVILL